MSTIEAEVEFYFVKSHFAKESSIAKDAGLSNSNPVENYVVLLKRSLEIHNIKILDIKGQYISQGVGKKCSVTTQRIRFPSELRNQIQEKLISILHEANLNSISRKDVGDIAVVKKIFDDNNIQHIQNIQNQQAQKNKYVPPQILPQNPLQQQQYQNNFSHNNFQHNGQQIVQSQNNNQPISYNTNQAQQQHYQQVPQNYIQQNNQEAQAKAQMNKLQNHNNYQQNANPQSQAQQYQSLPQSLQQYQGIPDFETRTNSSIESDSSQMGREIQRLRDELETIKNERDALRRENDLKIRQKDDEIKKLKEENQQLQDRIQKLKESSENAKKKFENLIQVYNQNIQNIRYEAQPYLSKQK